jgi:peptidoglycan/LPS O-acetylase OafA/YrhL
MRNSRLASPQPSYDDYRSATFFSSLDGLRCISILAVIWHHTGIHAGGLNLARQGYLGVDLFFAISGFLITTLLLRERERFGSISLRDFYIRRTLRIFPLYYAVVLIYVVLVLALERGTPAGRDFLKNLPYFLTYTANWFVVLDGRVIFYFAWSLATEEQFYLVWPTIEKLWRGWKPVWLIVAVLLVRQVVEAAVTGGALPRENLAVIIVLAIYPPLLGGVVMAHVLHDRRTFERAKQVLGTRWAAVLILAALFAALEFAWPRSIVWTLMVVLVGAVVIRESNGLAPLLTLRPVAHIGMVSYGMYLMHMLSYNLVKKALAILDWTNPWLLFPVTAAIATLAATFSYYYYEAWFLRLKQRFTRVRTRHSEHAAAPAPSA